MGAAGQGDKGGLVGQEGSGGLQVVTDGRVGLEHQRRVFRMRQVKSPSSLSNPK